MRTYMIVIQDRNTNEEDAIFFNSAVATAGAIGYLLDDEEMRVELYKRGAWGYERANISDELSEYFN